MTPQEARKIIIEERDSLEANPMVKVEDCLYEALDMAIKALETTEQVNTSHNGVQMFPKGAFKAIYEDNEDCISRQVVKDMLTAEWTKYMPMELDMNLSFVLEKISELPSVTPKAETEAYNKGYTDAMRDIGDTQ